MNIKMELRANRMLHEKIGAVIRNTITHVCIDAMKPHRVAIEKGLQP